MPTVMIADVFPVDSIESIDKLYSYRLPGENAGGIGRGSLVRMPFGAADRTKNGVVVSLRAEDESEKTKKLKTLSLCEDCELTLSEEQMRLIEFLRARAFCTRGEAFRALIPSPAYAAVKYVYTARKDLPLPPLSEKAAALFSRLAEKGDAPFSSLFQQFGRETGALLSSLKDRGLVGLYEKTGKASGGRTEEKIALTLSPADAGEKALTLRGETRRRLMLLLIERGEMTASEWRKEKITSSQIAYFEKEGWIERKKITVWRDKYTLSGEESEEILRREAEKEKSPLSEDQKNALDKLTALAETGEAKAALLFGVTGSGKTRVITSLIDYMLAKGKTAVYLVPEIALTPQTLAVFSAKYGDKIALFHSALSDGERFDAWRRMRDGTARIAVGTRSAVFAPLPDLGLIVIDEEQEHTYKSDSPPRYHAREVASFRAGLHKALLVLASATPSLETAYKAETGVYVPVTLPRRFNGAPLPETKFADMREDLKAGVSGAIGRELRAALKKTLEAGEQAILFLNRRGYRSSALCPRCGKTLVCPHCSVAMTFHSTGRVDPESGRTSGYLSCHYCGHRELLPSSCPSCGGAKFAFLGFGTQKAEEELSSLFPSARILRLDADAVRGKNAYEEKLSAFRARRYDILLGTQMVVKGHDFPAVTLVGVLAAESSLYLSDYRANEITFDLLTQVTGRAGRADKSGSAIIQTFCPDHPLFAHAKAQDYPAFYRDEIALRKSYLFPPFCDVVCVELSSGNEAELLKSAVALSTRAVELVKNEFPSLRVQIFGPFDSPLYKVRETYRMRLIIKCRLDRETRAFLEKLRESGRPASKAKIAMSIDCNPGNV